MNEIRDLRIILLSRRAGLILAVKQSLGWERWDLHICETVDQVENRLSSTDSVQQKLILIDQKKWIDEDAIQQNLQILHEAKVPIVGLIDKHNFTDRLTAWRAGIREVMNVPFTSAEFKANIYDSIFAIREKNYKVLIIDDQRVMIDLQKRQLRKAGFEVKALNDPTQILSMLDNFDPDVLLIDQYSPSITGAKITAVIRQNIKHQLLPIVFHYKEEYVCCQIEALNSGGDLFFSKPMMAEQLASLLKERAERSRHMKRIISHINKKSLEQDILHTNQENNYLGDVTISGGEITYTNKKTNN